MSILFVLLYIVQGATLRKGLVKRGISAEDAFYLELFSRILVGQTTGSNTLATAIEQGIVNAAWEDVYDTVNPFGDRRGGGINSVWTFDLDKRFIFLTKNDRNRSAPLDLARERLLTEDDFEPVPEQRLPKLQSLPGPYWEPVLDPVPRETAFLGRLLRDFAYAWRHIIRRDMKTTTFKKLACAIIQISRLDFTLLERIGFEHVSPGGAYVNVVDLPRWRTPEAMILPVESSYFVLSPYIQDGLKLVRGHAEAQALRLDSPRAIDYAILTIRQIVCCRALGSKLLWTKPEELFHDSRAPDTAIGLILNMSKAQRRTTSINHLPVEIQDKILRHATASPVASAKLGCELGLGSPFTWVDDGVAIGLEDFKRHRTEFSPVESQIILNGENSGLSYKREIVHSPTHERLPISKRPPVRKRT